MTEQQVNDAIRMAKKRIIEIDIRLVDLRMNRNAAIKCQRWDDAVMIRDEIRKLEEEKDIHEYEIEILNK